MLIVSAILRSLFDTPRQDTARETGVTQVVILPTNGLFNRPRGMPAADPRMLQ